MDRSNEQAREKGEEEEEDDTIGKHGEFAPGIRDPRREGRGARCLARKQMHLRCNGSSHITALPGEVQSLNPRLSVALKPEDVDDVEELRREEGDPEVEDAVAKADSRHQALDSTRGDGIDSDIRRRAGKQNERRGCYHGTYT